MSPVDQIRPDQEGAILFVNPSGQVSRADGQSATSLASAITAFNGGGQSSATALAALINKVTTTVATAPPYDSVKLPAATGGPLGFVVVVNATANPIQVFGTGTDTINGVASGTGITQPANSVDVYWVGVAGQWFVDAGIGFAGSLPTSLAQDTITAHAGGGQGSATQLNAEISRITTVANPGDSVMLPASAPGLDVYVINHGANSIQVFGAGTDTIDDVATATGVSQMIGSLVLYSCTAAGRWYSNGIGTGFSGSFPTVSFVNGLTAHAGGGQGSATPLTAAINRVTTVATAADSVALPTSAGGMQITVSNAAASNSMNVFPASGDQINALGANTAFAVAAGKTAAFTCAVAGQWHAILSA